MHSLECIFVNSFLLPLYLANVHHDRLIMPLEDPPQIKDVKSFCRAVLMKAVNVMVKAKVVIFNLLRQISWLCY